MQVNTQFVLDLQRQVTTRPVRFLPVADQAKERELHQPPCRAATATGIILSPVLSNNISYIASL